MGGFFGAASHRDVVMDVFFGVDYHSHLGTRRAGMIFHDSEDQGFQREIHSIENTPFRTRFEDDLPGFHGQSGIGCISDTDPQPLLVRSHLGTFALTTVGAINNAEALVEAYFSGGGKQFMAMSSGDVNTTELVAALINQQEDFVSGIKFAQDAIEGSLTLLVMTRRATRWGAFPCSSARTRTATASRSSRSPTTSWATTMPTSWDRARSCAWTPTVSRLCPLPAAR